MKKTEDYPDYSGYIEYLEQHGFDNVVNIAGSYLGICLYEYAQDVLEGREKIVTAYNFN